MDIIGGRKILFGLLFLGVGVVIALKLGDLPRNLMEFMIYLSAGFFLGNGVEHVAGAIASKKEESSELVVSEPSPPDSAPINNELMAINLKLDDLKASSDGAVQAVTVVQQALSFIIEKLGWGQKK